MFTHRDEERRLWIWLADIDVLFRSSVRTVNIEKRHEGSVYSISDDGSPIWQKNIECANRRELFSSNERDVGSRDHRDRGRRRRKMR